MGDQTPSHRLEGTLEGTRLPMFTSELPELSHSSALQASPRVGVQPVLTERTLWRGVRRELWIARGGGLAVLPRARPGFESAPQAGWKSGGGGLAGRLRLPWACTAGRREESWEAAEAVTAVTSAQGGGLCRVGVARGEKGWIWDIL